MRQLSRRLSVPVPAGHARPRPERTPGSLPGIGPFSTLPRRGLSFHESSRTSPRTARDECWGIDRYHLDHPRQRARAWSMTPCRCWSACAGRNLNHPLLLLSPVILTGKFRFLPSNRVAYPSHVLRGCAPAALSSDEGHWCSAPAVASHAFKRLTLCLPVAQQRGARLEVYPV